MSRGLRRAGFALVVALAILAGWRIIATRISDAFAAADPRLALSWDAGNPWARLALASQELESGHAARAADDARELLRRDPLQADAFTVLARVAVTDGQTDEARRLFALALRRAPRDQYARAWVIGDQLEHGAYTDALRNVDTLFNIAPVHEEALIPLLTRIADSEPGFAAALGTFLASHQEWRSEMLGGVLGHARTDTVDRVFSALQAANGLDDAEAGRWYARLERDGRWGEAYSRWAGRVATQGQLALVYNGSFERPVTGTGFDWEIQNTPGVVAERVPMGGGDPGFAVSVTFLHRRADDIRLGQRLLLAPGHYQLRFRASARDVQSAKGLQWMIRCVNGAPVLGTSTPLGGTFAWKAAAFDFTVPTSDCPAQWLALVNPGAGSGKLVSGEMWFTGFEVAPSPLPE